MPTTATIIMREEEYQGETGFYPYSIELSDGTLQFFDLEARRNDFSILKPLVGTRIRKLIVSPEGKPKMKHGGYFVIHSVIDNHRDNGSVHDMLLYNWDEFEKWQEELEAYDLDVGSLWRHVGNGKLYEVLMDNVKNAEDGLMYVVYQNSVEEVFTRPKWRFLDRFKHMDWVNDEDE